MNKEQVRMSKACEISGKSRIFFDHNHLSHKDENGNIFVEWGELKKVIDDDLINAQEHLHRLEIYEKQTANK
jgi:hypothetical protein